LLYQLYLPALGLALFLSLFCFALLPSLINASKRRSLRGVDGLCINVLKLFRWLFHGEARDVVDLAIADVQRDIRGMKKEKRSRWFINLVVFKHTVGTIVPILFDTGVRVFAKLGPIARWLLPK